MKRLILSVFVMIVGSLSITAQDKNNFSFSIGPELSFATGSFSNTHTVGTGGTVQAEYYVMEKLKATATFGLLAYVGKSGPVSNTKNKGRTIIPIRVGAKYFLTGGIYGGAQIGVAFLGNYQPTGTAFAYSPLMLGYEFKTKSEKTIDATIKYDAYTGSGGIGTVGAFGIRLAYVF
ncbi:MAG: hypothetical protein H7Z13_16845 [Ferruginibacter sp.]|nr:hypothetical protein [Ferruginibacter sp.]